MQPKYIFFEGKVVPYQDAKVHVSTVGVKYGASVFEGIRGYWNEEGRELYIFRLEDHLKRLNQSIRLMGMETSYEIDWLKENLIKVLQANEFHEDVHIRPIVYLSGEGRYDVTSPVDIVIPAQPTGRLEDISKGINCCVSSWKRISDNSLPPRVKCSANYINSRYASIQAKIDGYESAIFLTDRGRVSEGLHACLFLVRRGSISTPTITSDILESITRDTVIVLLNKVHNLEVIEREIGRTELYAADEVFFCGTGAEITPVVSIDRHSIGDGKVGRLTKMVQDTYFKVARGTIEEFSEWRTPTYGK